MLFFFFSSRRRHTRSTRDWSSDVCSSDLAPSPRGTLAPPPPTLAPAEAHQPRPGRDLERRDRVRAAPPAPPTTDAPGHAGSPRQPTARCRRQPSARFDELAKVVLRTTTEVVRPVTQADVARPARSLDGPRSLLDETRNRGRERLTLARQLTRARFNHFRQIHG